MFTVVSQHHFRQLAALMLLSACGLSSIVNAATVNGVLNVTAIVGAGCQVNNSNVTSGVINFGTLDFGSINTLGNAHIDTQTTGPANGSIEMECSDGTTFTIALDNGQNFSGGNRAMVNTADPASVLSYELYQDVSRTLPWSASSPLTGSASGVAQVFPIYGRIPGGQGGVAAGTYNDTVQVVISW